MYIKTRPTQGNAKSSKPKFQAPYKPADHVMLVRFLKYLAPDIPKKIKRMVPSPKSPQDHDIFQLVCSQSLGHSPIRSVRLTTLRTTTLRTTTLGITTFRTITLGITTLGSTTLRITTLRAPTLRRRTVLRGFARSEG
jgi:hypothetical protein